MEIQRSENCKTLRRAATHSDTFFHRMVSFNEPDSATGCFLIDREPTYIPAIISYLSSLVDDGCRKTPKQLAEKLKRHAQHLGRSVRGSGQKWSWRKVVKKSKTVNNSQKPYESRDPWIWQLWPWVSAPRPGWPRRRQSRTTVVKKSKNSQQLSKTFPGSISPNAAWAPRRRRRLGAGA